MSETKFTPGPWFVGAMNDALFVIDRKPSPSGSDAPLSVNSGAKVIVKVETFTLPDEANAHLIAAAPEMYEALEEVVAISDRKHNAWDKAHAALAKARGQSK